MRSQSNGQLAGGVLKTTPEFEAFVQSVLEEKTA